jgi:zinc protease
MPFKKNSARSISAGLFFLILWTFPVHPLWAAMPSVKRTVLPNRLVVLLSEEHSLPFVTIQMLVDGGSRRDPAGKEGLAFLTAKGLLLGTSKQKLNEINEALDFIGASLYTSATKDYATISLRVLKKDLEKGLGLFADSILRPTFAQEELEKEKKKILGAIQADEEQPGIVAEKAFNEVVFKGSPYSHPVEGTKEAVPALEPEAVTGFYRTFYRPNNAILAVVGDITPKEVKTKIIPLLSSWSEGKIPPTKFSPPLALKSEIIRIDRDLAQANIIVGEPGVSRSNPDYYALTVMNYILGGGGFGSRLMDEIRVDRGLAYSVASFFDPKKVQGSFQIVLQTKNASAGEAISLALGQMNLICRKPVPEEALERAKKYLVGSFPKRIDTQKKLVNFLSQVEYFGLGLDYPEKYPLLIKSVSRADVLRVAQKYLHSNLVIRVIVGNLKEAGL